MWLFKQKSGRVRMPLGYVIVSFCANNPNLWEKKSNDIKYTTKWHGDLLLDFIFFYMLLFFEILWPTEAQTFKGVSFPGGEMLRKN